MGDPIPPAEFGYLPLQRVVHGAGATAQLAREAERLGARRILLVTGTTLATKTELPARVREIGRASCRERV